MPPRVRVYIVGGAMRTNKRYDHYPTCLKLYYGCPHCGAPSVHVLHCGHIPTPHSQLCRVIMLNTERYIAFQCARVS